MGGTIGGKKVFLHSLNHKAVLETVNDAKSFFSQFFTNLLEWHPKMLNLERMIWLCMYGIPLHVWNMDFFTKVLSSKGCILLTDLCPSNISRLDFARFYFQTPMMGSLNDVV